MLIKTGLCKNTPSPQKLFLKILVVRQFRDNSPYSYLRNGTKEVLTYFFQGSGIISDNFTGLGGAVAPLKKKKN